MISIDFHIILWGSVALRIWGGGRGRPPLPPSPPGSGPWDLAPGSQDGTGPGPGTKLTHPNPLKPDARFADPNARVAVRQDRRLRDKGGGDEVPTPFLGQRGQRGELSITPPPEPMVGHWMRLYQQTPSNYYTEASSGSGCR